jgi:2-hydroxychromene-2-carboxylate isomerase
MFCDMHNIPLSSSAWTLNKTPPPNSIPVMRFMRVLEAERPDLLSNVTDKLFARVFAEGDATILSAKPDQLAEVLNGTGLDKDQIVKLMEKATGPEFKDKPKDEAKGIVEEFKAFGAPHMRFVKPDGSKRDFMGSDHFELIAYW